jgi:L-glutamine-phosphate cytidylyltransferase
METDNFKALVVAAGMGRRMKGYTTDLPKCMLPIGEKTLLEHAFDTFRICGATDLSIVCGYKKDKIKYPELKYYENTDYENNNILASLFYAEEEFDEEIVISYSDIVFEKAVVDALLRSNHDITLVVDVDWRRAYEGRKEHPLDEAENVVFKSGLEVAEIGKIFHEQPHVDGEFIGMLKLSARGAKLFKSRFHEARARYAGAPFQRAKVFEKAYVTDIIQEMVDQGDQVHCVTINGGWREIDTIEDYERAVTEFGS